jgi:hypothetical protein
LNTEQKIKKNMKKFVSVLFILTLALTLPALAGKGDKKSKKGGADAGGEKITAVDASSITTSSGTYSIGSDTKVTVNGQDSTAADLKVGMKVTVTAGSDPKTAASIAATAAKKKKDDAGGGETTGGGTGGGE